MKKPKYTLAQMAQAFTMIRSDRGWKKPINIVLDHPGEKNLDCVREAVLKFTNSAARIKHKKKNKVQIVSRGYKKVKRCDRLQCLSRVKCSDKPKVGQSC